MSRRCAETIDLPRRTARRLSKRRRSSRNGDHWRLGLADRCIQTANSALGLRDCLVGLVEGSLRPISVSAEPVGLRSAGRDASRSPSTAQCPPECSEKSRVARVLFKGLPSGDRKSTRRTPVTNAHLVCRLLLETKKQNT